RWRGLRIPRNGRGASDWRRQGDLGADPALSPGLAVDGLPWGEDRSNNRRNWDLHWADARDPVRNRWSMALPHEPDILSGNPLFVSRQVAGFPPTFPGIGFAHTDHFRNMLAVAHELHA